VSIWGLGVIDWRKKTEGRKSRDTVPLWKVVVRVVTWQRCIGSYFTNKNEKMEWKEDKTIPKGASNNVVAQTAQIFHWHHILPHVPVLYSTIWNFHLISAILFSLKPLSVYKHIVLYHQHIIDILYIIYDISISCWYIRPCLLLKTVENCYFLSAPQCYISCEPNRVQTWIFSLYLSSLYCVHILGWADFQLFFEIAKRI
jgi:hypothetical protein